MALEGNAHEAPPALIEPETTTEAHESEQDSGGEEQEEYVEQQAAWHTTPAATDAMAPQFPNATEAGSFSPSPSNPFNVTQMGYEAYNDNGE